MFNYDISIMIQSLGGNTLSQAFDIVLQAENNLIDAGKLAPRRIMPVFLEISTQVVEETAPSTSAPQSMYSFPTLQFASLAVEVSDKKNLLRSFSNKIVNLKRAQVSPTKPPFQQDFQGNHPPYQHTHHCGEKPLPLNVQIVPVPNPLQAIYPTAGRELTVGQNNLVNDTNSWCFPCNNAHALRNFPRGNLQQKVVGQRNLGMTPDESVYTSLGMDNVAFVAQMQGMSLQQEAEIALDRALFS